MFYTFYTFYSVILTYKKLKFHFLFTIPSQFYATVVLHWKPLSSSFRGFVIVFFLSFSANQVNVYMIHQDSDLCYGIFSEIINIIKDKVTTFHWFFQPNLISCKKWFENIFNNLTCFIISCDFYGTTPQMNYTLFISVFRKNIYNCYC